MIEQILVCEGHTYKSVVYKYENRVSSENGFGKENTSALNSSQKELILVSLFSEWFLPKAEFEKLNLSLSFT